MKVESKQNSGRLKFESFDILKHCPFLKSQPCEAGFAELIVYSTPAIVANPAGLADVVRSTRTTTF